jgi:uncharacterized protein YgbK (DUF1537 family)
MEVLCRDERVKRIPVDPVLLIDGGQEGLAEVKRAAGAALLYLETERRPRAILFETALHGQLLDLAQEDEKRNYTDGMSANRINAGLGMIVSDVLKEAGMGKIAGLYTTGGDTMVNVCYQLGVESIEVLDYVIAQTDVGRLSGNYEGLPIIGKGGLTGNDQTAVDVVDRLFLEAGRK